jgi:hypothetical protein
MKNLQTTDRVIHVDARMEATNVSFGVTIDPSRGVRVVCDQDVEGYGGPVVTVLRVKDGWLVVVRPRDMQDGAVKVAVAAKDDECEPMVRIAGVNVSFNEMFDMEEDEWEDE